MIFQATKKVTGGKLVRVKVDAEDVIQAVKINGDFFLHPEDALPAIEKSLAGMPSTSSASDLAQKIHEALAAQKAAFLGVSAEDIAQTIIDALGSGQC